MLAWIPAVRTGMTQSRSRTKTDRRRRGARRARRAERGPEKRSNFNIIFSFFANLVSSGVVYGSWTANHKSVTMEYEKREKS